MVKSLKKLMQPPDFDDPRMTAQARSVQSILFTTIALTILFLIIALFFLHPVQSIIALVTFVLEFVALILLQRKNLRLAGWIFNSVLWVAIFVHLALYGGFHDATFGVLATIALIAGLTLGIRAGIFFAAISVLAGIGLAIAENLGLLQGNTSLPVWFTLLLQSINLIAIVLLLNLVIRRVAAETQKTLAMEKSEKETKALLDSSQAELSQQTITLEKRNTSLQTIARFSRLATEVKTEHDLLERSAALLLEINKLNYVSIYLLDQMEECAILQVFRGGEGNLPEPSGSILNVIRSESANPPIVAGTLRLKIGDKYFFIEFPRILPDMKTSLIYPLSRSDKLMGLINIQTSSIDNQAMDEQTMQLASDQIVVSMLNIRLLNQLQSHVQDVGEFAGGAIRSAWDQLGRERKIGYTYDRIQVLPANETFPPDVTAELRSGKAVTIVSSGNAQRARIAAPILLRDAIIGVIGYDSDIVDHEWQEEEKALLETIATRVSLALENARLFEETTRRADRERTVSEITTRIRSVSDPQVMVQTALEELKRALGANNIQIRPYSPASVVQNDVQQPVLKDQNPTKSTEIS
jgi:GAF domain